VPLAKVIANNQPIICQIRSVVGCSKVSERPEQIYKSLVPHMSALTIANIFMIKHPIIVSRKHNDHKFSTE